MVSGQRYGWLGTSGDPGRPGCPAPAFALMVAGIFLCRRKRSMSAFTGYMIALTVS